MKQWKLKRTGDATVAKLFIIIAAVLVVMSFLMPGVFFTVKNFKSMAFQFPEFGIFAIAMALAVMTGGCDLSIVSVGNLAAILSGTFILKMAGNADGFKLWLVILAAFLIALVTGMAAGLFNGLCIAGIGIPPILTTLGTMQLFAGIGIVVTRGTSLYSFPEQLNQLGNGYLFGFLPIPAVLFLLVVLLLIFLIQKCSFGIKLYMIGTNAKAAEFSGADNRKMVILSYMLSGILAATAGFIILARTNSANADYGSNYIIQSMLVAIMGGVDPKGGKGKVTGIVMAVFTLQLLSSGLNMMNVSSYFKQLIYGALLLSMIITNTFPIREYVKKLTARVCRKGIGHES